MVKRFSRPMLIRVLVILVVLLVLPSAASASWWNYSRPADYESVVTEQWVPTRDGTRLHCQLRRPGNSGVPAAGRFPVIVSNFFPYALARDFFSDRNEYFTTRGYVTIGCDVRGSGESEGSYPGIFHAVEARDNYDLIEWAARQPWSNGRVGQEGVSYGGMTAYRVAGLRPPHLRAIAPQFASSSIYLDFMYPGGIPSANAWELAPLLDFLAGGGTDPAGQLATWAAHPLHDAHWRQVDVESTLRRVKVPVFLQGGWWDYFRQGTVRSYQALKHKTWLVVGPWFHNSGIDWTADGAAGTNLPRGTFLAWFDRWLKRLPRAPLPPSRVTAYAMPEETNRAWQQLDGLPPSNAGRLRLHLTSDGRLARMAGRPGSRSYVVNPVDGPSTLCFPEPPPPSPCGEPHDDQRSLDAQRLTFTGEPLSRDLVVYGAPRVRLEAALSATNGNLVAKLMDVAPDGTVREASVGYLRASHRRSHSREAAIVPGVTYKFEIPIEPVFWRFQAGHRLRISLTSGDQPRIDPSAEPGTVTVATGRRGSYVDLTAR